MNKTVFSGLTVNWHFTQVCNMKCKYCFVAKCHELGKNEYDIILNKIKDKFERVNFVGGEPTMSPYLIDLIKAVKNYGLKVTLVTNGYKLVKDSAYADELLNLIDGIGISIDSLNPETNLSIGRCHCKQVLTKDEYISLCKKIKGYGIPLKINTVVSRANINEDFNDFYKAVQPDRIKMFQVLLPNLPLTREYTSFLISDDEYKAFVSKHSVNGFKIVAEDNEHMIGAYIMINSEGCFENNDLAIRSESLLLPYMTAEKGLEQVSIDMKRYMYRYAA